MVAAASCLDEDVERCNALSAGGRALADAGRSLAMFEDAAFVDLEWSCATEPLAAASISLQSAAQALTGLDDTLVLAVEPFPLLIGIRLHFVLDRVL